MATTVLVTGATGNIGREVLRALADRGVAVRAGARTPSRVEARPGVTPTLLDYDQPDTFAAAFDGVDGLALLMPPFSPADELMQARMLVDAARKAGVQHIVKLSVMSADANPQSAHRQAELYIEESGIAYTHLRPNFYMQNFNMYYADDVRRGEIYLPAGDGKQSLVDSRDVGDAFAVVFTTPGHQQSAYNLTGAEALDHYEIAAILSRALSRDVTYVAPSADEYRETMQAKGVPEAQIESIIALYDGIVARGWAATIAPELGQLLGRTPRSFEQYAQDYAHLFRAA
jgi:uncharacterized protein YbjT (DUF2867 family)